MLNLDAYGQLLAHYKPRVISTEAENDEVIARCHELEHRSERTPEKELMLELLVKLIEPIELKLDPESKAAGIALKQGDKITFGVELQH
jgi:hypothetical protein